MTAGHHPSRAEIDAARLLLAPWRWLTAPHFEGVEHVPRDRPFLMAGNHTVMGVLDSPLLVLGLWERCGVFLRGLGDHLYFPGAAVARPARALRRGRRHPRERARADGAGESILVFPGGGRQVCKRKGESYTLIWGQRTGFARLAIEHGYPILPVSVVGAVGADDAFDILTDADDLLAFPSWSATLIHRRRDGPPIVFFAQVVRAVSWGFALLFLLREFLRAFIELVAPRSVSRSLERGPFFKSA